MPHYFLDFVSFVVFFVAFRLSTKVSLSHGLTHDPADRALALILFSQRK
jgi:hypothetical protein